MKNFKLNLAEESVLRTNEMMEVKGGTNDVLLCNCSIKKSGEQANAAYKAISDNKNKNPYIALYDVFTASGLYTIGK